MKNFLYNAFLFSLSVLAGYFSLFYLYGLYKNAGIFISGLLFGIFLMLLKLNVKNNRINSYKRELEKEAVTSSESTARVKVLESKIEVLEKALENALKKWGIKLSE